MEMIETLPVSFTTSAVAEIKRLYALEKGEKALRVGVKGGGCSGMTYVLSFDEVAPGDRRFEIDGVPAMINPAHEIYLYGMEIQYEGGLNSRGFTFKNPNASATCGCGTSFSV